MEQGQERSIISPSNKGSSRIMLNQVNLIGNLGADPEIRRTNDGKPIANLSVATTESWRDKNTGERKDKTEWHRVVIFNEGLCKVVESYLKKGSKVYLSGKLQTRKWQDNEGKDRYSTEVVLQGFDSKLVMLDGRSESNDPKDQYAQSHGAEAIDIDSEIPF